MEIRHNEKEKLFELYADEGQKVGEIEYKHGGNKDLYATHTRVHPDYEGRGYAGQLLDGMAAWAKEGGYKIVPVCSYVVGAFKKYPEKYADVMK